jgi:predicted peptidase
MRTTTRMCSTTTASRLAAGLAAVLALVLAGCGGGGGTGLPGGPSSQRLTLQPPGAFVGAPGGYAEYLPPGYGEGGRRPLLIFLHGSGENGDGSMADLPRLFDTGLPALIQQDEWPESRPFIVLMPQHDDEKGALCPDAEEVDAFVTFAIENYETDPAHVYLTGLSCGAFGGWDYLAKHKDEAVAAAVLIAGDGIAAFAEAGCALGRVPIWAFHGAEDDTVNASGSVGPISALKECTNPAPADARLTVYPGVDHLSWDQTYDLSAGHDIYAWLLEHEHAG